jgi:NADPH-dependent 2,4-dienoyl-CoA reductase/sulfur reductase-like enzyme
VVAGTGPLLLAIANQLHEAGVRVLAVLEAGRPPLRWRALARAWRAPSLIVDAWRYWKGLRRAGIPLRFNHTVFQAHGDNRVRRVTYGPVRRKDWRPVPERGETVDCDLLVAGFGFVPNTELSNLAGCRHDYDSGLGGWFPERDALMRTSVSNVYAAGDGAGVAGSLVAEAQGRIAGISAAEHHGAISTAEAARRLRRPLRKLRALRGARELLESMSRIRSGLTTLAAPATLLCRCEEVNLEQVRSAISQGAKDLQAVKLLTRLGMGPCQGRVCAPGATDALCAALGRTPHDVGRINPRPPVKPVTLATLATLGSGTPTGS